MRIFRPSRARPLSCSRSMLVSSRLRDAFTVDANVLIDSACESQNRPWTTSSPARSVNSSNRAADTRSGPSTTVPG